MPRYFYYLVLLCLPALSHALDSYTRVTVEGYSEAFPLYDILQGLENEKHKGQQAFLMGKMESGIRHNRFHYGLVYRHETFLQANPDTNTIIFINETGRPIPDNGHYAVDLEVNRMQAWGASGGIDITLHDTLEMQLNMQLLNAVEMLDGTLQGDIQTYDKDYQGKLNLDYFYTSDSVFDRHTEDKTALGLAADVHLQWQVDDSNSLSLAFDDIVSGIFWRNMYHTRASLLSDRISYDENDKINVRAALKGYEGNKHHTQILPVKIYAGWHYSPSVQHVFAAELAVIEKFSDIRFSYQPLVLRGIYFYAATHSVLGAGYRSGYFSMLLASDNPDYRKAGSLLLQMQLLLGF